MIITFDNKEDYAIWQQMVARQLSNTKTALEMAKFGGANKKWQEMMATLWSPQKNNTQVTTNGHGWWQGHS